MYEVNETMTSYIESGAALYSLYLESTSGSLYIGTDQLSKMSSTHSCTTVSDDVELGAICSQEMTITLIEDTGSYGDYVGTEFDVYLDAKSSLSEVTFGTLTSYTCSALMNYTVKQVQTLGSEFGDSIPMGKLTCVKAPSSGNTRTLTLYDRLYFADNVYTPGITLPALSSAIEQDICSQIGCKYLGDLDVGKALETSDDYLLFESDNLMLTTISYDFTITSSQIPENCTMREMLKYIAITRGQFGYIDRQGRYVTKWYGDSVMSLSTDVTDVPTISQTANEIVGIICTVDENTTLTEGETSGGRVLEFTDPFMTESLLKMLLLRIQGFTWYTASVKCVSGDPRLDVSDVVTYSDDTDYTFPITTLKNEYDGGFVTTITAAGLNEEEQSLSTALV